MKNLIKRILPGLAALTILVVATASVQAQSTTITYGGELRSAGFKADGLYDVRVGVYDAATGGNLIGDLRTNTLEIVDGKFTARMDFGESVFTGGDRWLEVGVRPAGVGDFNTLSPRQSVTSIPHAIVARSATSVTGPVLANQLTGLISPFNIGAATIEETMMASNSVGTDNLMDRAVTAEKIRQANYWSYREIFKPKPASGDQFGTAVAAVGIDRILVGVPGDDVPLTPANAITNYGAAYLFRDNGNLLVTLTNPIPQIMAGFGRSVAALKNDRLLIGSDRDMAFLFETNGELLSVFTNPAPHQYSGFGQKVVAMPHDQVLISAPFQQVDNQYAAGVVYRYRYGILSGAFTNPAPANRGEFGISVTAVGSQFILIGAPGNASGGITAGVAYLFHTNGTLLQHFISPEQAGPPGVSIRSFGNAVAAVGNDRVLIASYRDRAAFTNGGAAYLFHVNGSLLATMTNPELNTYDLFGFDVAVEGDLIAISSIRSQGTYDSSISLFGANGQFLHTLGNPVPDGYDFSGSALAILKNGRVVVGAHADDTMAPNAGTVYLFYQGEYAPGLVADAIRGGSVDSTALGARVVTTSKLADEAVTVNQLANDAVTSLKILDAAVEVNDLHFSVLNETFWRLDGNTNTVAGTHFLGTTDEQPLELRVNNQPAFRISFATNLNGFQSVNIIAGDTNNFLGTNVHGNFIAGGGSNWIGANSGYNVIGGGAENTIPTNAQYATIPGGLENSATEWSFAAGVRAKANHLGSFVWNGTKTQVMETTAAHQFLIGALGGVGIGTNNPQAQLHVRGTVMADAFVGDGSGLSNVTSTATVTNPIPDFLLPATVARLNTNQTFTASNTFGGVVIATNGANQFNGQFTGIVSGNGAGLTNLNFGSTAVPWLNLTGVPGGFADGVDNDTTYSAGPGLVLGGTQFSVNFAGSGAATNVSRSDHTHDATNIISGTLNDGRLSSNVPLRNGTNIFTGTNVFAGVVIATNGGNQIIGQFTGNGAGLTNLNVGSLAGAAYVASNQTFTASNTFAGVVTATNVANQLRGTFIGTLNGNGAGVTNLDASNLATGTVPDSLLPANVSRLGSSIDSLEVTDGTIMNADISASAAIVDTKLATIQTAGKVANSATTATTNNTANTIVARDASGGFAAGNITATFTGNGSNLTNLNASQLTTGTVPDARLSNNIPRLNLPNTFTAAQVITNGGQVPLHILGSDVAGTWINLANASLNGRTWNFISSGISNSEGPGKLLIRDAAQGVVITLSTNGNVGIGTVSPTVKLEVIGTVKATDFIGSINVSNLAGGSVMNPMSFTNVGNTFVGNGSGLTNVNAETLDGLDSTAFWRLGGNNITSPTTQFLGTTNSQAVEFRANNSRALRLESTGASPNLIGGYGGNLVGSNAVGTVIAGGGRSESTNRIFANYGVIGGGRGNTVNGIEASIGGGFGNVADTTAAVIGGGWLNSAMGAASTIGGGYLNTALGTGSTVSGGQFHSTSNNFATVGGGATNYALGSFSTVAGGTINFASGNYATIGGGFANYAPNQSATIGGGNQNTAEGSSSTVGGGFNNQATNDYAAVLGGSYNTAGGDYSVVGGGLANLATNETATVPGGYLNLAGGIGSFAVGVNAKAIHNSTFVWSDYGVPFTSSNPNQFLIRASGGVGINTNNPGGAGLVVNGGIRARGGSPGGFGGNNNGYAFNGNGGDPDSGMFSSADGQLEFFSNDQERIRITSAGDVGIGTPSPGFLLHVNGSAGKPGGGSWSVASDARLKKNIQPMSGVLEKLLTLHGVNFEYKEPDKIGELSGERIGLLAQEVEAVFPDWVETGTDGYKRVTVRGLEALLIEGLRELQQQKDSDVRALNQKLTQELKRRDAENAGLKQRLDNLERLLTPAR